MKRELLHITKQEIGDKYKTKEERHKLIAKLIGVQKEVLDIGYAQHPNLFLNEVIGVDIQINKVENYKKVYKTNLNKDKLPFKENRFKTIIASEIIEHVENPSFLLREINRVLEYGGNLLISTPQAHYYWWILRNLFLYKTEDDDKGQHLNNWGILDFKRILTKNGFRINKMYGSFIVIPYINFKLKRRNWVISTERFPRLSQLVLYDCTKIEKPDDSIITHKPMKDYEQEFPSWEKVKNE